MVSNCHNFIYITAKGNFTDQHLQGTKAYKWHYRRREGVNEALRPSDRKVIMVIGREYLQQLHKRVGNPKVWKSRLEKVKDATIDVLSSMGRPEDPRYKKRKSIHKHTTLKKYNDKLLSRLSKGFDSEPTNVKRKFVDKLFKYSFKESVNEGMTSSQGKEVLRQLGGGRFIAMTGAKNFGTDGKSLTFKIGRNSKGVNFVRIKLTSMDLYDIEFLQVRAGKIKIKSKAKRVYADQLGKMFKKNTGMNVRL